jgi:hypothetical protein
MIGQEHGARGRQMPRDLLVPAFGKVPLHHPREPGLERHARPEARRAELRGLEPGFGSGELADPLARYGQVATAHPDRQVERQGQRHGQRVGHTDPGRSSAERLVNRRDDVRTGEVGFVNIVEDIERPTRPGFLQPDRDRGFDEILDIGEALDVLSFAYRPKVSRVDLADVGLLTTPRRPPPRSVQCRNTVSPASLEEP